MNKLLSILFFIFFTITSLSAQKLQYNLQGGLGFASQSLDNDQTISKASVTTYYIRGLVEMPFKNMFYLQTGLGVSGKGVKEYQDGETITVTLTYLDIPLTAVKKFDIPTLGKVYLGAGPYISFGLNGNYEDQTVNSITATDIKFGSGNDYKKTDFGANFVGGLQLNNHLSFDMKYSLGLSNIAEDSATDGSNSAKNRVFTIGLGFWL